MFSREEISPLSPQQCMKYGSSPFYSECELIADFSPRRNSCWDLSGNDHWFSVERIGQTLEMASGGCSLSLWVSIPFLQARVSLCSLWLRYTGVLDTEPVMARRPLQAPTASKVFISDWQLEVVPGSGGVSSVCFMLNLVVAARKELLPSTKAKTSPLWMGMSPLSLPDTRPWCVEWEELWKHKNYGKHNPLWNAEASSSQGLRAAGPAAFLSPGDRTPPKVQVLELLPLLELRNASWYFSCSKCSLLTTANYQQHSPWSLKSVGWDFSFSFPFTLARSGESIR